MQLDDSHRMCGDYQEADQVLLTDTAPVRRRKHLLGRHPAHQASLQQARMLPQSRTSPQPVHTRHCGLQLHGTVLPEQRTKHALTQAAAR